MASSANLGVKLEAYVDDLVKSGRYNSRSKVLRAGIDWLRSGKSASPRLMQQLPGDLRMLRLAGLSPYVKSRIA